MGIHPARQWCDTLDHSDLGKAPVHVAAERGHLHILRIFYSNDIRLITVNTYRQTVWTVNTQTVLLIINRVIIYIYSCLTAGDKTESDAKAWNYALRYKQKDCARYLLAKCFSKVPLGKGAQAEQISISVRNVQPERDRHIYSDCD